MSKIKHTNNILRQVFFKIVKINLIMTRMSFLSFSISSLILKRLSRCFWSHLYTATGRPCRHYLYPMLKSLLLQLTLSIPTFSLIIFLKYSQELQDFFGFSVVLMRLNLPAPNKISCRAYNPYLIILLLNGTSDNGVISKKLL